MSLRLRLTALGTIVVLLAVGVFGWITVTSTHRALLHRTDEEIAAVASGLLTIAQAQVERVGSGRPPLRYKRLEKIQLSDAFPGYAIVMTGAGRRLPLPRLARESETPPDVPEDAKARAGHGGFDLAPNYRARVVKIPETDSVMFLAFSLEKVDAQVRDLRDLALVAGAIVVLLSAGLLVAATQYGLRPLRRVVDAADDIAEGRRAGPVDPGPEHTEIGELTDSLNAMLASVERSASERDEARARTVQFAADAAHELRTPVTAILGYADLQRHGGLEPDRFDEVFSRIYDEASRLRGLVDGLLVLNRLELPDTWEADPEVVDLAEVCALAASDSIAVDSRYPVTIDSVGPSAALARADEVFQMVTNLLANVRAHTPQGTTTTVTIHDRSDGVVLDVVDDGPGVPDDVRDRAFERFTRGPTGGTGLGLAIVRSLARANGGDSGLGPPGNGGHVWIRLPRSERHRRGAVDS